MKPSDLQQLLDSGTVLTPSRFASRIITARNGLVDRQDSAGSDLVVLVRQALEHWTFTERLGRRSEAVVYVPSSSPWPTRQLWARSGVSADPTAHGRFALRCLAWRPDWLSDSDAEVVEAAVRAPMRRETAGIPCDPLVSELLGIQNFYSRGQRDAVRSIYLAPPGSTILVILPTGGGKSLAFQFAALHGAATGGMTVVVVPTVALARDQERRYRELAERARQALPLGVPLAFHSGLSDEERVAIRKSITNGVLPIIFAAPEAVLGTLQRPLLEAARRGLVANFVIDEAHIVAQWAEFRPEFQAVAGFRDALHSQCPPDHPFRTLLLTATLTAEGHELLRKIFGRNGSFHVIAEVALRNEPGYIVSKASSPEQKRARLLEALFHLPRPMIVYTTKPDDAEDLCLELRSQFGFRRLDSVVGGDMATQRGEEILRKWTSGELDVIIATSAFGLGVDQSDVRSVIHACLPESIDRWYQEVGRAGRDGCASVALLIADDRDVSTAVNMARQTLIGHDKAWHRWKSMWSSAQPMSSGCFRVSLAALAGEYDVNSGRNENWNLRTLAMMVRAGILRFTYSLTDTPADGDEATARDPTPHAYVAILDLAHHDERTFEQQFMRSRAAEKNCDEQDVMRIRELLGGIRSVHELLRETYEIPAADVFVPKTAGDCPVSRRTAAASHVPTVARCIRPREAFVREDPLLAACRQIPPLGYFGPLIVRFEVELGWQANTIWLERLQHLAALGIVEFDWPSQGFGTINWRELSARSPIRYVFASDDTNEAIDPGWNVPRASLIVPTGQNLASRLDILRPFHVLFVPPGLRDPHSPYRRFDTRVHIDLPIFMERIRAR